MNKEKSKLDLFAGKEKSKLDLFAGAEGIRKALENTGGGGGKFLTLQDGEELLFRFIDDIPEMAQVFLHYVDKPDGKKEVHTCLGAENDCPLCLAGLKATYRVHMNLYDVEKKQVLPFSRGLEFIERVLEFFDGYGTVTDRIYKMKGENTSRGTWKYVDYKIIPISNPQELTPEEKEICDKNKIDWRNFFVPPTYDTLSQVVKALGLDETPF